MDIVTPSLDQVLPKVDSRYTLVSLAAKRARDIMDGSHAVTAERTSIRDVTNALEEIYEGKITYKRLRNTTK
ncbi:DNA-directed RNA polymerase subunit omega [Anaerovibrio lipolyticus DSM 3074]|uniref:DNA-directed RNA polymerase subunit omega n=2 Tax=Anaerovibrio lipolyticus TaxID=82374 RepID=A0A0B2JXZ3_9FIRM|nr:MULTISPECIES: DNA-directed RNA polymerase subunit omega [Anaerovibrio]MBQ1416818.1 DNA-directed RNA polymerase subunit omega [Selenomonas sp.]KHM52474.1 DNA-directed RNA polymerase subunit omega [Anaerovibrio lipolyticus]MBP3230888.1 DNA-directed RNA polymerase subunit omega [Anaerovibrio sp.]MBQ1856286.1 DNA-directed RNA polymerase subunit omega [Anaerovibrio sp.]MBR2142295.1 DNA-directed RNA polymerase subunit omega [Anaerovibrio sp.]